MESTEFDTTLGGTEHLPYSANSLKFAVSRSVEIAAMTESILRPSKTKLVFQTLPVHMRRRVMSHNSKRLPRKLRQAHMEQLKKSGLPPKQKRPSRKYRRRPGNLLEEYNRRQKRNIWLETHIWHAKRFHMMERWGYRLAYAPCDKSFRACYRGSSSHCLLQDISYLTPIQIAGPLQDIKDLFASITSCSCGLGICAKAFVTGNREGTIHLYEKNSFPFGYIGTVSFIWVPSTSTYKNLWLFVHPSQAKQIESVLTDLLCSNDKNNYESSVKKRKLSSNYSQSIQIKVCSGNFNRFRLTGPNSHPILVNSLKCIDDIEKIKKNYWVGLHSEKMYLKEKSDYWNQISSVSSPSQLPPKIIIGLVVKDPRLMRPSFRTKAEQESNAFVNTEYLLKVTENVSISPLWNPNLHEEIKNKKMSNGQFIEHLSKTQLVPGEINKDDPALQSIPVVLIQRPGSQDSTFKKIGYGNGWDIIVPSGYGLPFWLTFIMYGARSGGLRESENLALEMGECYFPPDSNAGRAEEKIIELQLKEKYFSLPPSKRVNYIKLGAKSPFICPWKTLLKDWSDQFTNDYFVLRDRKFLHNVEECINKKKKLPQLESASSCLVAVYLQMSLKGNLKRHALICLPEPGDLLEVKTLFEQQHDDTNANLRKLKKSDHIKNMKRLRRKQIKLKKRGTTIVTKKMKKQGKLEPSEHVKNIRELWLPSEVKTVRHANSRQTMGYVSQGNFSFTEARSCGVGYVTYNALQTLLNTGLNQVLVRNTSSRKYRLANFKIVKHF